MPVVKDFTGRQITTGVKLAYPVRRGSTMCLRSMVVNAVSKIDGVTTISGINDKGSSVKLIQPSRTVIIP